MCDILMMFGGGAANLVKFMHEGLLIQFARNNGLFRVRKLDFESSQL